MRRSVDGRMLVSSAFSGAASGEASRGTGAVGAYVLVTNDPETSERPDRLVTCTVVLEDGIRTVLRDVPVLWGAGSGVVHARAPWRPTPTTRSLDTGAELAFGPDSTDLPEMLPERLDSLDGDRVLVEVRGPGSQRVGYGHWIAAPLPHPRAPARAGDAPEAWASVDDPHPVSPNGNVEWFTRAGAIATVDEAGNVAIDTTATPLKSDGTDTGVTPSGCVALNLKAGAAVVLRWNGGATALRVTPAATGTKIEAAGDSQLLIGAATQKVPRGETLQALLTDILKALALHTHPNNPNPVVVSAQAWPTIPADLLTDKVKVP